MPSCEACARALIRIEALEHPPADEVAPPPKSSRGRAVVEKIVEGAFIVLLLGGLLGPLLSLAIDPRWRLLALGLAAPVLLIPVTMAGAFLWSLGWSFRELRDLARDRKTRIIHGFEHATAKILEADQHIVYGGLTHASFFELHLYNEGPAEKQALTVRKAVKAAVRRIRDGEKDLAYHPKCGTSQLVTVALLALMALSSAAIGFFADLPPEILLAIGAGYALILLVAARPLGLAAQRFLTVSTVFRSARVLRVVRSVSHGGDRVTFDVYFHVRL